MAPLKSVSPPRPQADNLDAAINALREPFTDLVTLAGTNLDATNGPEMPAELVALAQRAESVGWTYDLAEAAIRALAREATNAGDAAFE